MSRFAMVLLLVTTCWAAPAPFLRPAVGPGEYQFIWAWGDCRLSLRTNGQFVMREESGGIAAHGDWWLCEDGDLALKQWASPASFSLYYGFALRSGKCYQGGTFSMRRIK